MAAAVEQVQEQLSALTPFEITNDAFRTIVGAGAASLKSAELTKEQLWLAKDYLQCLRPKERAAMKMRQQGHKNRQIAAALGVSLEWVRRSNAKHMYELRWLLYPG